jgi:4'-phosphopantetheinyl transferase EntD
MASGMTDSQSSSRASRVPASVGVSGPSASCDEQQLQAALQTLATPGVRLAGRSIGSPDLADLFPVERVAIAHAVPARQAEFASGRVLLRSLLGEDRAIPVGADRAPVLPAGVRASLAHDARFAVAVLSREPAVRSLGIDIEPQTELSPDMVDVIVRPEERHINAHLAFTLKEATYKAWSRLGGRMLEFHEVRLTVDVDSFVAEVVPHATWFSGRFVHVGDRCVALVVVVEGDESRVLDTRCSARV